MRLVYGEIEHLADVLAAMAHPKHVRLESPPLTHGANQANVRQELHLDRLETLPATRFASAAIDVEREVRGTDASCPGLRLGGEELADRVPGLGVGGSISPRSATEG